MKKSEIRMSKQRLTNRELPCGSVLSSSLVRFVVARRSFFNNPSSFGIRDWSFISYSLLHALA